MFSSRRKAIAGRMSRAGQARRPRESGAALLVLMTLIVLTSASVMLGKLNSAARSQLNERVHTASALASAKAALLAYATTYPDNYGDTQGPGYLPCPDTNNNGSPNPPCGPDAIGRLPDHIIVSMLIGGEATDVDLFGLSDIRDGVGERLWYAVSDDFRNNPKINGGLNSETPGELVLDGGVAPGDRVVALIFAPGGVVADQNRENFPNDVAQYLEGDNATVGDQSFVSAAAPSVEFNDQVVAITHRELMNAVEKRVMAEVSNALQKYDERNGASSYGEPAPVGAFLVPPLSPFSDPKIDELTGTADVGSGGNTLADSSVDFIDLGVRIGDVVLNETDDSMGVIEAVNADSVDVAGLRGGASNSFSVGDTYQISRYNAVDSVAEGLLPFHRNQCRPKDCAGPNIGEPFKTDFVVDWNLRQDNGVDVTTSAGISEYETALENFVQSTAWSGSVPVSMDEGFCVWDADTVDGEVCPDPAGCVKCAGFFQMTFFEGSATKTHATELEDSTLHFDEWGVVAGAFVDNLTDGSSGIVAAVNDHTLDVAEGLSGGTDNSFAGPFAGSLGDDYRVRMPTKSTNELTVDFVLSDTFLMDFDEDFSARGIEAGDTIYNVDTDDWGIVTGVSPNVLSFTDVNFNPGNRYVVRYDFIQTREYEFTFHYDGKVSKFAQDGIKRRTVCSNDGFESELGGVDCDLVGTAGVGSGGLDLSDDTIANFGDVNVGVGDMVFNTSDGSRGIVSSITSGTLTVSSLNGGIVNQFSPGDAYRIQLTENVNDDSVLDTLNDDLASVQVRDRNDSGSVVGSASAEVPENGTTTQAAMSVQSIRVDLEVQLDGNDTDYDLPLWFTENRWHRLIYVAASSDLLPGGGGTCPGASPCLTVTGLTPEDDKPVLIIAAGPELGTQDRLAGTACGAVEPAFFCDYFEGENADFDFDDAEPAPPPTFEHTPISNLFNDQIRILAP